MIDRRFWIRWTLIAITTCTAVVLLVGWGLYAVGARDFPDNLSPAAWHASPGLRQQYLAAENIDPAGMPRLNPVTVWYHVFRDNDRRQALPMQPRSRLQLLLNAARVVSLRESPMDREGGRYLLRDPALMTHISRNWTPDDMVDTILAESGYARDVRGFDAAAQFYFQLPAKDLRPQESLALIALLRGPSWYDPVCHRDRFEQLYAQLAQRVGGRGPAWTSAIALARLRAHDCPGA